MLQYKLNSTIKKDITFPEYELLRTLAAFVEDLGFGSQQLFSGSHTKKTLFPDLVFQICNCSCYYLN